MALSVGTAFIDILPNMSKFTPALAAGTKGLAGTMSKVGTGLTKGVTVPLLAGGAAATKMALDFNKAFVQIQTLGGKTGQSMEALKSQVLDLAEATGEDPEGLANALYLVTSAGKDAAANAIPILTAAAKGAALGMGDVNEIAKVLTATTNSYGAENLSAAQAMDVLTQATTDSSAEADELAASLGPVIGIAAQLKIPFEQVAAAMATATTQGVATDRAATGLRFLMASLSAPTQEASQKLEQYGFTAQDLQRLIAKEGLQGTLDELADTFDLTSTRGQQAWNAVTGGARGAIVANTLVGEHAADAAAEVENLGNVAGTTQEKFELWGHTITGQNAKALGSLKAAAIRLGTDLIPIFQKIVEVVSKVVDAYNDLSPAAKDAVVKFGLMAAAAGPLLRIFSPIVGILGRLGGAGLAASRGVAAVGSAASGATQNVAGLRLPLVGASQAMTGAGASASGAAAELGFFSSALFGLSGIALAAAGWIKKIQDGMVDLEDVLQILTGFAGPLGGLLQGGFEGLLEPLIDPAYKAKQATMAVTESIRPLVSQLNSLNGRLTDSEGRMLQAAVASGDLHGANMVLNGAIRRTQEAFAKTNWDAWIDGVLHSAEAEEAWAGATKFGNEMTLEQSKSVAGTLDTLAKYGVELSASKEKALASAVAYGRSSEAVKILDGVIAKLPKSTQVKIRAEGVEKSTKAFQQTRIKLDAAQTALRKYGGELNKAQRGALAAAQKEGRFGDALKIVQRAINRMNPAKAKKAHDDIADSAQRADKFLKQLPQHMSRGAAELNGLEDKARGAGQGMDEAGKKADDLKNKINNIPDKHDTKVTADTTAAKSAIDNFIASNNGRTINLRVLADMPGNAKGTKNWPGGFSVVGELGPEKVILPNASRMASGVTSAIVGLHGPEIVNLPRGSDVIPHGGFAKGVKNFKGGRALVGEKGPELVVLPGEKESHHVSVLKEVNQRDITSGADGGDDGPVEIFGELTLTPDGRAFVQGIIADNDAHAARIGRMSR